MPAVYDISSVGQPRFCQKNNLSHCYPPYCGKTLKQRYNSRCEKGESISFTWCRSPRRGEPRILYRVSNRMRFILGKCKPVPQINAGCCTVLHPTEKPAAPRLDYQGVTSRRQDDMGFWDTRVRTYGYHTRGVHHLRVAVVRFIFFLCPGVLD